MDLRNAIARGRGWLVTETDLRLIESLCISGRCIQETRQDLEYLKPPLRIEVLMQPSVGISGRVAQYYGLENLAAIESKLAQFPRFSPTGRPARTGRIGFLAGTAPA